MKEIFEENDIYTNLKERLANPFIFSFAASWLFWNWPITLGLIWYNSENIKLLGYEDYAELIVRNSDNWNNYYYPLIFAGLYTVLLPILKWGIDIVNAFFLRRNQDSVLKVTKTGYIPTLKYYDLKDSYDEYIHRLSKLVNDEATTLTENNSLKSEIVKLESEISSIQNTEYDMKRLADPRILEGAWFIIEIGSNGRIDNYRWYIDNERVRVAHDITSDYQYTLSSYICNPFSKMASIQLKGAKEDNRSDLINHNSLKWSDDLQSLKSTTPPSINLYRKKPREFRDILKW